MSNGNTQKKTTSTKETSPVSTSSTPTPEKPTNVAIKLSVFKYNNKVVSAYGIADETTSVSHRIRRSALPDSAWHSIVKKVNTGSVFNRPDTERIVAEILSDSDYIRFPEISAKNIKSIEGLIHSVDTLEVRL